MRSPEVDALLAAEHISTPNSGQPESQEGSRSVCNRISQTQMFQAANSISPSNQLQQYAKENFHE
jgi:hypothetical protein